MPPRRTPAGLSMTAPGEDKSSFTSQASAEIRRRLSSGTGTRPDVMSFTYLSPMWAGLAANVLPERAGIELAISIHDGTYSTDFAQTTVRFQNADQAEIAAAIEKHIVGVLKNFSTQHLCKFLGAGVTTILLNEAPSLCTTLWRDLDIVPIVFNILPVVKDYSAYRNKRNLLSPHADQYLSIPPSDVEDGNESDPENAAPSRDGIPRTLDEQSDSAARKCVMFFGPNNNPRLVIGHRNRVEVDAGGKIHLIDDLATYRASVGEATWTAVNKFADELRSRKVKIGFFSSTPQGGGVALMRHALIRFLRLLDVNCEWYVPNPSPAVFRTTKDNHNILQGVADKSLRLTDSKKQNFTDWIEKNSLRYWFAAGGPLAEGGVDVAFVDDPQMPGMIPLIKKFRPNLPIIYRSHIEIRSDLVGQPGSPQEEVWQYLWNNIKLADLFISHPMTSFVPKEVPTEIVGLMPACTDWLDGLNKELSHWDTQYYMGVFRQLCAKEKMVELAWPARPYIVQVARFDPAKGIPHVIESYVKFRQMMDAQKGKFGAADTPQLLICGHGAVDDPDATIIYDQVMGILQNTDAKTYAHDVIVMRLPPSDQLLNALMSSARIAMQLSSREGFEVKVSEAIHDGRPIIATRAGGIPLQVQHGKNGFLVEIGNAEEVSQRLWELWTDDALYDKMSDFARTSVSDEVSTVGNAACWLYLAAYFTREGLPKLKPNGEWINELLRKEAGVPYKEGENRLPRLGFRPQ